MGKGNYQIHHSKHSIIPSGACCLTSTLLSNFLRCCVRTSDEHIRATTYTRNGRANCEKALGLGFRIGLVPIPVILQREGTLVQRRYAWGRSIHGRTCVDPQIFPGGGSRLKPIMVYTIVCCDRLPGVPLISYEYEVDSSH